MKSKLDTFLSLVSIIGFMATPNIGIAKEIDASPLVRVPPIMPQMANHSGHCKAVFDITGEGHPVNISISFCTDNVFRESAKPAIEKWVYTPKTVNGIATLRKSAETQITFKLTDMNGNLLSESEVVNTNIHVFDNEMTQADLAYPWPPYFGKPKKGEDSGFCCMDYSVSQIGSPFNVNIESCSHKKFAESANMAIRQWKYKPVTSNKKTVSSTGYLGVIHFAKRDRAMIKDPNGYTPLSGKPEDYERYCRAIS